MRAVAFALMATCLVVALALWSPLGVRAARLESCISGLPADLAAQLQPLIQALAEANGDAPNCEPSLTGGSGLDPPSQQQKDLELIAEALALLAMADPGYGYASPGYGYSAPGCGPP
jgi:hypothetical protein